MKNVMSNRNMGHSASRGEANNEPRIGREMFDVVEHLSDTLVNDTSRSVAASLTKEHQRARENIKAGIIYPQVGDQVKANESETLQILSARLPSGLRWIGVENILDKLAFADGNPALPHPPQTSIEEVELRFNRQEGRNRGLKSKSRRNQTPEGIQKRVKPPSISKNGTTPDKRRFLCPISSCVRARPEAAFKRRYLMQEHLNFHRREKPFCCDRCPQRFTSRQNLARHRLIHTGVTYTCSECRHVFLRSSDRSKCLRNHKLQRIISEQGTNATPTPAAVVPKAMLTSFLATVNGPYICPVCPDQRGYKLDSSLRKHLRLHHPNYKRTTGAQVSQVGEGPSKMATQPVLDPQRPPSETSVVNYSLKTPAIAMAPDPTASQLPISLGPGNGAYLLSTGDVLYAVVPQYTGIDQFLPVVGAAGVDGTEEQRPTILMELAPAGSGVVEEAPRRTAHSAVLGVTEGPLILTHCLPVDLCTSALCLTVTDPSVATPLSSASQHPTVIPVETGMCPSIAGEGALDLTELPHEVIDLSHSNPVDLSGAHPNASRPTLWEPEPGFSFTDLLNVDDEDPRGLLLGGEFEVGLDLRLPDPL
ncbi:hypothetical protein TSMEX_001146 [Taenia solium]|eukprot:TsM_000929900 transcript=TsM_000929900 gene=TsM_000929900